MDKNVVKPYITQVMMLLAALDTAVEREDVTTAQAVCSLIIDEVRVIDTLLEPPTASTEQTP